MVVSTRGELSSELAVNLLVFAGCLSERLLSKKSIWTILLLLQQPEFECFLTGSLAARSADLLCTDAQNPASHPVPPLSVLLPGICCPSALQPGLAGAVIVLLGHAQPVASCRQCAAGAGPAAAAALPVPVALGLALLLSPRLLFSAEELSLGRDCSFPR